MIDLEERVSARLHERVGGVTVKPDLDDIEARAGQCAPEGRVSRRVVLGVAASLVAVAVGGLVVIGGRTDESPMPFGAVPPVDATGSYPVIDEQLLPPELRGELVGDWGYRNDDEGWTGVVGVDSVDSPTDLISISVSPSGVYTDFADAQAGRRHDVMEVDGGDSTTLIWTIDDHQLVLVGDNRSTMYDLVDLIDVANETTERGGFTWNAPLPNGLTELVEPFHAPLGTFPFVSTNDGRLDIEVGAEPPLVVLAASGLTPTQSVSIREFEGYASRRADGHIVIAVTMSATDTLVVASRTFDLEGLLALAGHIEFVDEQAWREFYHVDFECSGCDGMLTGPPVTPPTTS